MLFFLVKTSLSISPLLILRSGTSRADTVLAGWETLTNASTAVYNTLSDSVKPAYFQMVHHPVLASSNLGAMWIAQGMNALRASQARLSTNDLATQVEELFEKDYDLEAEYHSLLDGKITSFFFVCYV